MRCGDSVMMSVLCDGVCCQCDNVCADGVCVCQCVVSVLVCGVSAGVCADGVCVVSACDVCVLCQMLWRPLAKQTFDFYLALSSLCVHLISLYACSCTVYALDLCMHAPALCVSMYACSCTALCNVSCFVVCCVVLRYVLRYVMCI